MTKDPGLSVIIRNKNQAEALEFALYNLTTRYSEDISEILVLDNLSDDTSRAVSLKYGVRFQTIEHFSYGGSANLAASLVSHEIAVIFSAHAYPVSHDFFKLIKAAFKANENLAGVRCIHNSGDYKRYINNVNAQNDPKGVGLIFCGSAFKISVWKKHRFKDDIKTFEDKEWSLRVLKKGYSIITVPAIFCYDIARSKDQEYIRFKNEIFGAYQLWHHDIKFKNALNRFVMTFIKSSRNYVQDLFYGFKKLIFMLRFLADKPEKFQ
ncbi:glycosyltransferase [Leeuwenhoekiella sp. LLG6367-2.1]|uniref:glycosyltransferase n=1 Tax=Leeuwenhoekiella sp. LLG6367-2.1 TaxID=3160833 RepID=UPI003863E8D5